MSILTMFFIFCTFFFPFAMCDSLSDIPSIVPKSSLPPRFQWPAYREHSPNIPYLSSTFAESRLDHFHNGIDLAGQNELVYPVANGKALYTYYSREDKPYEAQRGTGNIIVLDHGQGWWSGYYHLLSPSFPLRNRQNLIPEEAIAKLGNTGHSSGSHLHFFLSKDYGRKLVNPFLYLPPIRDSRPPRIMALVIHASQSITRLLPFESSSKEHSIRLTQPLPIYIEAEDPGNEKGSRRGVYLLSWELNGKKQMKRNFSSLQYQKGTWQLGEASFSEVYQKRLYYLGKPSLKQGRNEILVKVEDYHRNATSLVFLIQVMRQY